MKLEHHAKNSHGTRAFAPARALALVAAFVLACALAACTQTAQSEGASASSQPVQSSSSGEAVSSGETTSLDLGQASSGELYGKPWIDANYSGNLPEAAPEAVDDLYLHYAYDYIAANQDTEDPRSVLEDEAGELQEAVTAIIKDESVNAAGLDQLRIFYEQASDLEALEAAGADELRPYLKSIADTTSLAELEDVLFADDYPFEPWLDTATGASDMRDNGGVTVAPKLLFSDAASGADLYQEPKEADQSFAYAIMAGAKMPDIAQSLLLVSLAETTEQAGERANELFEFEKAYGKEGDYQGKYEGAEYGAQAADKKVMTLDELQAACPNFPFKRALAKHGEDASESYIIMDPAWLPAFNEAWTEENFKYLHDMSMVSILLECKPYLAPSLYAESREESGEAEPTPDEHAYAACDSASTFGSLLAQLYVEQVLGESAIDELEALTNGLIDSYIELVGRSSWLEEQSRENVIDKIDNIALNVLQPNGGYAGYEGLQLTPTDQGGTLLGNYLKLKAFSEQQEAALVGKPATPNTAWIYLSPTMQNCFYEPLSNSINIFPGFVTSSMYHKGMTSEELLGGIGFVIGHEISHAFDYDGSQFGAYGQAESVFEEADVNEFVQMSQRLIDRYSSIEYLADTKIDGVGKSSEAAADLCGLQVVVEHSKGIEGFDLEKMFGYMAATWASVSPSMLSMFASTDEHAPVYVRINASAQMLDGFYETYGAAEGDTMYLPPEERIVFWGK